MLKTNSKKARENIRAYIITNYDPTNYELPETENEKKRYTEREAESFLTRLIYNEIKKEV